VIIIEKPVMMEFLDGSSLVIESFLSFMFIHPMACSLTNSSCCFLILSCLSHYPSRTLSFELMSSADIFFFAIIRLKMSYRWCLRRRKECNQVEPSKNKGNFFLETEHYLV